MARGRRSHGLTVVLVLAALYLLYLAVPNIAPAVRAARADGVPGVFTARHLQCVRHPGHQSCAWTGEFTSDDGRIHRADVSLKGGRDPLREGARTKAVDVGRASRVYGPDGSSEWVVVALMILTSAALVAFAAVRTVRRSGHGEDDLAARVPALDVPDGLGGVGERMAPVQHGHEPSGLDEPGDG